MDRREALTSMGLSALAGALLTGCGREEPRATPGTLNEGEVAGPAAEEVDDGLVDLLFVCIPAKMNTYSGAS